MSAAPQTCCLSFGRGVIPLSLSAERFECRVISPHNPPPLADPHGAFLEAVRRPIAGPSLAELGRSHGAAPQVAIAIADHTRPVPDGLLIPWILAELGLPDSCVTVLIGTGSHRDSTPAELEAKLGRDLLDRLQVVNHHGQDPEELFFLGTSSCGGPCWLNRRWVEADIRIATGFIEPHFYAGFSGGSKAVVPGIAGLETVKHFHRASLIDDPSIGWGRLEDNALQALTREMTAMCPPHGIVNVTLNLDQAITGLVAGHVIEAHRLGCAQAAEEAMISTGRRFPVVVTTNSGHPLDQNFYQTVKGISAAARICEPGGHIIVASSCAAGLPDEGEFAAILGQDLDDAALLEQIRSSPKTRHDQWQAQSLLQASTRFTIHLHSQLDARSQTITRCRPCGDIAACLEEIRHDSGVDRLPVAILPRGPLTIPVP